MAQEVVVGGGFFCEWGAFVGAIPADGGGADDCFYLVGYFFEGFDEEAAAFGAAVDDFFLSFVGPPFVGYACTCEVNDVVGLRDGLGIDLLFVNVPMEIGYAIGLSLFFCPR